MKKDKKELTWNTENEGENLTKKLESFWKER